MAGMLSTNQLARKNGILFWECRHSSRAPMYFYGALHFGAASMYPLPRQIDDAYAACDALAFETDLGYISGADFHARITMKGRRTDGSLLEDNLTPDTWQKLCETAVDLGYSPSFLEHCQSWYCASLLTSAALQRAGLANCLGIDGHLFALARDEGTKSIITLETPEHQLELLSGINGSNDEQFITGLLEEIANMEEFSKKLLELWMSGDAVTLAKMVAKNFAPGDGQKERMLLARNRNWLECLLQANQEQGSIFTVIGAGHLVGRGNLVDMFVKEGYSLAPLHK